MASSSENRLLELRKRRGLTAPQVARCLGCSISLVFSWEGGREEPGVRFLKRLSELYRVTVDELIGSIGTPRSS